MTSSAIPAQHKEQGHKKLMVKKRQWKGLECNNVPSARRQLHLRERGQPQQHQRTKEVTGAKYEKREALYEALGRVGGHEVNTLTFHRVAESGWPLFSPLQNKKKETSKAPALG
jgi:hypothetical protein